MYLFQYLGDAGTRVLPGLVGSLSRCLAPTSDIATTLAKFLSAILKDINLPFTSLNWTESSEQTFANVANVVPYYAKSIT